MFNMVEYMGLYFSGLFLIVCAISMTYLLLKMAIKQKKRRDVKFDEVVLRRIIREQTEASFVNIAETIQRERVNLLNLLEKGEYLKAKETLINTQLSKSKQNVPEPSNIKTVKRVRSKMYSEIDKMAAQGVPSRKIAEIVRIPKGEVDLLVKLRKKAANL